MDEEASGGLAVYECLADVSRARHCAYLLSDRLTQESDSNRTVAAYATGTFGGDQPRCIKLQMARALHDISRVAAVFPPKPIGKACLIGGRDWTFGLFSGDSDRVEPCKASIKDIRDDPANAMQKQIPTQVPILANDNAFDPPRNAILAEALASDQARPRRPFDASLSNPIEIVTARRLGGISTCRQPVGAAPETTRQPP